jgi:chromosome segregation ATPase
LVVLSGERQGSALEISRMITIGSNRSSDLHLRDAAVSWNHARVWLEDSDVLLEDLGSATGTFLGGNRVERARLKPGDTFTIGGSKISLSLEGDGAVEEPARGKGLADALLRDLEDTRKAQQVAQGECEGLREELRKVRSALESAESRAAAAEKRLSVFTKRSKDSTEERSKLLGELEDLRQKESFSSREAADAKRGLESLREELVHGTEALTTLRKEATQLESSNRELEFLLTKEREARGETGKILDSLKAELRQVRSRLEEGTAEAGALRQELDSTRAQREANRLELEAARGEVSKLRDENSRLDRSLSESRQENAQAHKDFLERLAALGREAESLTVRLDASGQSLEREKELRGALQGESQLLSGRLALAEKRVGEVTAELLVVERKLQESEGSRQSLEDRLRHGEEERARQAEVLGALRLELEGERKKLQEAAAEVLVCRGEADRRKQEIDNLRILDEDRLKLSSEHALKLESDRDLLRVQLEAEREKLRQALVEAAARDADIEKKRQEVESVRAVAGERHRLLEDQIERLERQIEADREALEAERQRFEAKREEEVRAHRLEMDQVLAKERERMGALDRESREKVARHEERLLAVQSERDAAVARASSSETRAAELEALLSKERSDLAEREETLRQCKAERAGVDVAMESVRAEQEAAGARLAALEKALEEKDLELSRQGEDIAWKNGELERLRLALRDSDREHRAALNEARAHEAAVAESLTGMQAELAEEKERHEKVTLELAALREDRAQAATEITMLRGYLEELKEKVREKERQILGEREESRRREGEQATRLLREKRKLEAHLREIGANRPGAAE